jgi:hypothetical protein
MQMTESSATSGVQDTRITYDRLIAITAETASVLPM